jgi:regulator of protease activity HflC (stomatin/prohibitin superfamily)
MARITVGTGERAVVRRDGLVETVLGPGRHRVHGPSRRVLVDRVDVRERLLVLMAQEVAAADVPGVKVSAVARWAVTDPVAFLDRSTDPVEEIRLAVQLAVRDWAATTALEELVGARRSATAALTDSVRPAAQRVGAEVSEVCVRDIVVPGEIRRAVLAQVTARQEGLAELERARAQTAALRALANGARVLEDHPGLLQLSTTRAAAEGGGTVVVQLLPRP